jgi:hypothetical protein
MDCSSKKNPKYLVHVIIKQLLHYWPLFFSSLSCSRSVVISPGSILQPCELLRQLYLSPSCRDSDLNSGQDFLKYLSYLLVYIRVPYH